MADDTQGLWHPEAGVTRIPDETAEAGSVKAANDAMRAELLRRSGREAEQPSQRRKRTAVARPAEGDDK